MTRFAFVDREKALYGVTVFFRPWLDRLLNLQVVSRECDQVGG